MLDVKALKAQADAEHAAVESEQKLAASKANAAQVIAGLKADTPPTLKQLEHDAKWGKKAVAFRLGGKVYPYPSKSAANKALIDAGYIPQNDTTVLSNSKSYDAGIKRLVKQGIAQIVSIP